MKIGRKICDELKAVRKSIADANNIEYTPNECTHQGECAGTCAACEAEVKYIEQQLGLRKMLGKAVVVAGLGLTVSSLAACGFPAGQKVGDVPYNPQQMQLEGDVAFVPDSTDIPTTDSCCVNNNNDGAE